MERGQLVQVTEYGGRKTVRRVVTESGQSVVVCSEKEYLEAQKEAREPDGIGFRREAVQELD